jgi:hypothetical protein
MLRKNKLIYVLSLIFCSPFVYAQQSLTETGFIGITILILGKVYTVNEALIKIALFAILFGVFFKGLQGVFPKTPSVSKLIAALMGIIAVRLMPNLWLTSMGKILVVAAIIIIPFVIINLIFKKWNLLKVAFLILSYLGVYLIVGGTGFLEFGFWNQSLADLRYYYNVYKFQFIVVIFSLIAYFSLRYFKKERRK